MARRKEGDVKIVINSCYGGFGLSKKAVRRMAELQGRPCYFFKYEMRNSERYVPVVENEHCFSWTAFDIPNPNEVLRYSKDWSEMTDDEQRANNELYRKHCVEIRSIDRDDPLLVQVVEELGDEASGDFAKLRIVEIPDGIKWQISEYDGNETIEEEHRSWS